MTMTQIEESISPNSAAVSADKSATATAETGATAAEVIYTVVINDEAQYSVWPTFRDVPAGWREVGVSGSMADCLAHVEIVWTDMRPASLRRFMDQNQEQ